MASAKDILLWTLIIGGTAGAIYYAYSIYSQEQKIQQSHYVTPSTAVITTVPPFPVPTSVTITSTVTTATGATVVTSQTIYLGTYIFNYINPTEPVQVKLSAGTLVITTSASPYSTLHIGYTVGTLPFTITIQLEWITDDGGINVEIVPYLSISSINTYEFGGLVHTGSYTYNPPLLINLTPKYTMVAPNNYVNITINENLMNYLTEANLLSILEGAGYIVGGSIIMNVAFNFAVLVNGIHVATYTENLVLSYTPGI